MFQEVGKLLVAIGLIILFSGIIFYGAGKLGLGRLPGDILLKDGNFTLYVPLATSLLLSLLLSVIIYLIRR